MTQTDLFDRYPVSPGYKVPGTSADAAASMKPTAATLRAAVLHHLGYWPDIGCTADECAERMGESVLSIRPRFSELFAANLIEDTGQRRQNKSGRYAIVWKAA
jgi:hypothetical protein